MSKVIITLGDKPSDCSVNVDGVMLTNAIGVEASVSIDNLPFARITTIDVNGEVDIQDVEFTPVVESNNE